MKRLSLMSLLFLAGCPETGVVCRAGTQRCGNGCADTSTDSRNCGTCGQACFGTQVCVSGACQCRTGTVLCNGQCVVTQSDPKNCGGCGMACPAGNVCQNRACAATCAGGATRCGAACVDVLTDPTNCGSCGNPCADSQSCRAGACQWDLVAACYTSGQVVGVASGSDVRGPLQPLGSGPFSIAQYGPVLLAGDVTDSRLVQARLPSLQQLSEFNALGRGVNQVLVDGTQVYAVNSTGHTLQVLQPVGDAGCPAVASPDAGCAYLALADGGSALPLGADAGCFYPATDAGCVAVRLDDGGLGPLALEDAGCFTPPPPPAPPGMPCFQGASDAGLKLATVGELDTGTGTLPSAVVKTGSFAWVPLLATGDLLKVDVSDAKSPHTVASVPLQSLNLRPFDGGSTAAYPSSIATQSGKLYVTLNNLDLGTYAPGGPGLLAVVDATSLDAGVIELGSMGCLNPVAVLAAQGKLFISCAGAATFDMNYQLLSVRSAGVVMLDPSTLAHATWSPQCSSGGDGGCLPILPSKLAVRDGRIYLGDQNGGRIFAADIQPDGGLTERRGYAGAMGGPIQACGVDPAVGFSNVSDLISLP
ncbi:MAG: hypothetical protein IPJ65_02965 [Archangiaceae bacterium]|nr:hypothetical protein [Archangiaceae bacterium]